MVFRLLATDYEKQNANNDPFLYPGKMPEQDVAKLPPTALFTAEWDYCRRDAYAFAKRLKRHGNLIGLSDMPGQAHAYEGLRAELYPEINDYNADWAKAFDAYVR